MAAADGQGPDESYTVRLSSRTTPSNYQKLIDTAQAKGWLNSSGQPNISKVINHIIGRFRVPKGRKKNAGR